MKKILVLSMVLLTLAGCAHSQRPSSKNAVDQAQLKQAIKLSNSYMVRACLDNGRFVYLDHLDPAVVYLPLYNEVRHAGALYPMGEYFRRYGSDPKTKEAMKRGAKYFVGRYVSPFVNAKGAAIKSVTTADRIPKAILGSWTLPEDSGFKKGEREVKLGGIGLGLVGLVESERAVPGTVSIETLRGLARGAIFLQNPDGNFYSKYSASGGKLDNWTSLYYPGEAALGLTMLYELDPDPKQKVLWLNAAAKALGFLAVSRKGTAKLPADHWALIATAKIWPYLSATDGSVARHDLMEHAIALCHTLLGDGALGGARSTPIACRLEGLLAMLEILPPEQANLRQQIIGVANFEVARLIECQVRQGDLSGAIPRDFAARPLDQSSTQPSSANSDKTDEVSRAGEIRIDYVQHALSAMMAYDRLLNSGSQNAPRN